MKALRITVDQLPPRRVVASAETMVLITESVAF